MRTPIWIRTGHTLYSGCVRNVEYTLPTADEGWADAWEICSMRLSSSTARQIDIIVCGLTTGGEVFYMCFPGQILFFPSVISNNIIRGRADEAR
jgi:hypothetical protein